MSDITPQASGQMSAILHGVPTSKPLLASDIWHGKGKNKLLLRFTPSPNPCFAISLHSENEALFLSS